MYKHVVTTHTECRYHLLHVVKSEAEMWYSYVASLGHVCPVALTIITAVHFVRQEATSIPGFAHHCEVDIIVLVQMDRQKN